MTVNFICPSRSSHSMVATLKGVSLFIRIRSYQLKVPIRSHLKMGFQPALTHTVKANEQELITQSYFLALFFRVITTFPGE
jgi:hypothetical protein